MENGRSSPPARRLLALLIGLAGSPVFASDQAAINELFAAGRYQEAYQVALQARASGRDGALTEAARALLDSAMKSTDSYHRWFALRAAQTLRDREVAASARRLAASGDRYERSLALEILAKSDPAGSSAELLEALDSPFRSVRLRALQGLAKLADRGLAERFAAVLRDDPDPDLRALAARALADSGAASAAPALHEALGDPVVVVQEEAVRALVTVGDDRLPDVLRRQLEEAPPEQRVRVLRLAALVPEPSLLDAVAPLLADGDPEVRAFAAAALLSIAERSAERAD